jgi:hypothetical protein
MTEIQKYTYDFLMLFNNIKDISDLNVKIYPVIKKSRKKNHIKDNAKDHPVFERPVLISSENAWKATFKNPESRVQDLHKIKGIFNKLSRENYSKMILQIKELDYYNEEVIDLVFTKIINEPFFFDIYANFCQELYDMHIFSDICIKKFKDKKHKNLCKFIGSLYTKKVITTLENFITTLSETENDKISDENLEILCEFIKVVGKDDNNFILILKTLNDTKNNYKPRFKFMIMDLLEKT